MQSFYKIISPVYSRLSRRLQNQNPPFESESVEKPPFRSSLSSQLDDHSARATPQVLGVLFSTSSFNRSRDQQTAVMPKGGRLVFKGGEPAMSSRGKKKDKLKRKRDKALARTEAEGGVSSTAAGEEGEEKEAGESVGAGAVDEQQLQPPQEEMRPVSGTGRITSSGTAVQGHEAKFMEELHAGDAILITHPTT